MSMLCTSKKIKWDQGAFIYDAHETLIESVMNILIPKLHQPITKFLYGEYFILPKEQALDVTVK